MFSFNLTACFADERKMGVLSTTALLARYMVAAGERTIEQHHCGRLEKTPSWIQTATLWIKLQGGPPSKPHMNMILKAPE